MEVLQGKRCGHNFVEAQEIKRLAISDSHILVPSTSHNADALPLKYPRQAWGSLFRSYQVTATTLQACTLCRRVAISHEALRHFSRHITVNSVPNSTVKKDSLNYPFTPLQLNTTQHHLKAERSLLEYPPSQLRDCYHQ